MLPAWVYRGVGWMDCPTQLCHVQEMEKLCSRKLRITAKETMNIAEKLYTKGYALFMCSVT